MKMLFEREKDLLRYVKGIAEIRVYGIGYASKVVSAWLPRHNVKVTQYVVTEKTSETWGGHN